jgi:hypothetical protein
VPASERPPNNRLKLAARGRPVADWVAAHARRSLAGALAGQAMKCHEKLCSQGHH